MAQIKAARILSCNRAIELPHCIPRAIFNGLGPIEQLAAKALETVGKIRIIEEDYQNRIW